ncbi:MAG: hypothetical protein M1282_03305 [Chloroflexi bacterium]|nr:hypothetical protein [Chloroflexota bacterium]
MTNQTLSVGLAPRIVIEAVNGDFSVVGWDAQELLVKADDENVRIRQEDQTVYFSCNDDLTLRMPRGGSLEVQSVTGDMALRGVTGQVELKEIQGDLSVRDVGTIAIEKVNADFNLRGAIGDVRVKKINADASVRDVSGSVTVELVASDLVVRGIGGNLKAIVGADAVVYIDPKVDHEYTINAGDDILAVLPPDADATLNLTGDEIEVDLPDVPEEDSTSRVVKLGNGSAKISLSAGGDLRVSGQDTAGETADEFGNLAGAMFDWDDFGREFSERISQRVNAATRRAQQQAERAARRAEQKMTRIMSHQAGHPGPVPPVPPRPLSFRHPNFGVNVSETSEARQPVSDEERITILKMLQEKKITSEEAEKLLSALEGGE